MGLCGVPNISELSLRYVPVDQAPYPIAQIAFPNSAFQFGKLRLQSSRITTLSLFDLFRFEEG